MPTFFARRYVRRPEAVGRKEIALGIILLLIAASLVATFIVHVTISRNAVSVAAASPAPPASPTFPAPGMPDWRAPVRAERFAADELHVKIDGRAEAYLQLGAVGLTFGTYTHASDAARSVDVYWYDMGTATNARRAFESEAPPGITALDIGDNSYQLGGAVFFWKHSSYMQLIPMQAGETDAAAAQAIARQIAGAIGRAGR